MSPSRRPGNMRAHHAGVMEARAGRVGSPHGRWRPSIAMGARPCRAPCRGQSRVMQNSQRVLLAKPRTAPRRGGASREARRPNIAPYRNGTAPRDKASRTRGQRAEGAGQSRAPRRGAAARWGHRALPQRDRTTGPDHGAGEGGGNGVREGRSRQRGTQRDRMATGCARGGRGDEFARRRRIGKRFSFCFAGLEPGCLDSEKVLCYFGGVKRPFIRSSFSPLK